MQNLQGDFAPFAMDRIGNVPMVREMAAIVEHRAASHCDAGSRWRNSAGDDQRDAVAGTLGVEGRQSLCTVGMFFQPGVHGPHQHAVFQLGEPQVERGE
jgi:hypothetical protein